MPNLKRWTCPEAQHTGALAPSRMRKNDIRRFCIPCSQATGFLVERIAPALVAKREVSKKKSAVKAAKKVVDSRARFMVAGIDAEKYMRKLALLPVFGGRQGRVYRRITSQDFSLVVEHGKDGRRTKLGHCSGWEIKLHTHPEWTEATLREVLIHELMHIHVPPEHFQPKLQNLFGQGVRVVRTTRHHTPTFHKKMTVAWRQSLKRFGVPEATVVRSKYTTALRAKVEGMTDRTFTIDIDDLDQPDVAAAGRA